MAVYRNSGAESVGARLRLSVRSAWESAYERILRARWGKAAGLGAFPVPGAAPPDDDDNAMMTR